MRGQVHTQGIENFWSLLKRTLRGTYVAVEPFHLDAYLNEQVFRYNNRATEDNPLTDADRFTLAVSQISGKRLTYAELTGKVGEIGGLRRLGWDGRNAGSGFRCSLFAPVLFNAPVYLSLRHCENLTQQVLESPIFRRLRFIFHALIITLFEA